MLKKSRVEKFRIREAEELAQGHIAREQQSWDSDSGFCDTCICFPYTAKAERGVGCSRGVLL